LFFRRRVVQADGQLVPENARRAINLVGAEPIEHSMTKYMALLVDSSKQTPRIRKLEQVVVVATRSLLSPITSTRSPSVHCARTLSPRGILKPAFHHVCPRRLHTRYSRHVTRLQNVTSNSKERGSLGSSTRSNNIAGHTSLEGDGQALYITADYIAITRGVGSLRTIPRSSV
jgi:hypothetical protein